MTHDPLRVGLCLWGGNSNNGSNCGPSYVNLNNGLSNSNWNIGGRLNFVINHYITFTVAGSDWPNRTKPRAF